MKKAKYRKTALSTLVISIACVSLLACGVYAKEVPFELRLESDTSAAGRQVTLEMVFEGPRDIQAPEAPFVNNLNIKYSKWFERNITIDGKTVPVLTHVYRVIGTVPGEYTIGPVSFTHKGDTYVSGVVRLKIEKKSDIRATASDDSISGEGKLDADISKHIYAAVEAPKTTVFVNEKIPLFLRLYSDWLDLEKMTFNQVSSDYLIADKFADRKSNIIMKDGIKYVVLEYRSSMFAVSPGRYDIDPVKLSFDIAIYRDENKQGTRSLLNNNADFYSAYIGTGNRRSMTLKTKPLSITVVPLPGGDQGSGFRGAVGDFKFDMIAAPVKLTTGEETRLRMTISGYGNYDTVSAPDIKKTEWIKAYEVGAVKGKDTVTYEYSVFVNSPSVKMIPEIIFSFFNPVSGKYESITRGPITLEVTGSTVVVPEEKTGQQQAILPFKDPVGIPGRSDSRFYKSDTFFMIQLLPVILMLSGLVAYCLKRYLETHPGYAAFLSASRKARIDMKRARSAIDRGNAKEFYGLAFRIMQEYLGKRRLLESAGVTGHIVKEINAGAIGEGTLKKIRDLFNDCYEARYVPGDSGEREMRATYNALVHTITELDKAKEL